jgi:hypothetical protein
MWCVLSSLSSLLALTALLGLAVVEIATHMLPWL